MSRRFSLCFVLGILPFQAFNPFWVNFCKWCKIGIQFCSSLLVYPVLSILFYWRNYPSPLSKISLLLMWRFFLGSWFCSIGLYVYFFLNPHLRTCLLIFIERGERRERERSINVKEKHQSVASCMCRDQGPNPQLRHVPWLRIESTALWFTGRCSNQLSHTGQGSLCVYFNSSLFSADNNLTLIAYTLSFYSPLLFLMSPFLSFGIVYM